VFERIVNTVCVCSETTYTNSLLPNTASSDTQQHVNNANRGGVDAEFAKYVRHDQLNLGKFWQGLTQDL